MAVKGHIQQVRNLKEGINVFTDGGEREKERERTGS